MWLAVRCRPMRSAPLVLLLSVACGVQPIPSPAGGTGGGSAGGGAAGGSAGGTAGGTAGGSAGGTGGGSSACAGLAETACRATPGCIADMCFTCICRPGYAGCRTAAEPMHGCPEGGCASPFCCTADKDCSSASGSVCTPPGAPYACGTCRTDPGNCTDDSSCANGWVCKPMACSCSAALECTRGCTDSSDCADGEECSGGAHPRCVAMKCSQASDCGYGFDCLSGACVRRACVTEADCSPVGGAYCVSGWCHRSKGECRWPAP